MLSFAIRMEHSPRGSGAKRSPFSTTRNKLFLHFSRLPHRGLPRAYVEAVALAQQVEGDVVERERTVAFFFGDVRARDVAPVQHGHAAFADHAKAARGTQ